MKMNPYTCRLLIRLDERIYALKGVVTYWSESGYLCIGNAEARTHFPGILFIWAAKLQNRFIWTRKVLSL